MLTAVGGFWTYLGLPDQIRQQVERMPFLTQSPPWWFFLILTIALGSVAVALFTGKLGGPRHRGTKPLPAPSVFPPKGTLADEAREVPTRRLAAIAELQARSADPRDLRIQELEQLAARLQREIANRSERITHLESDVREKGHELNKLSRAMERYEILLNQEKQKVECQAEDFREWLNYGVPIIDPAVLNENDKVISLMAELAPSAERAHGSAIAFMDSISWTKPGGPRVSESAVMEGAVSLLAGFVNDRVIERSKAALARFTNTVSQNRDPREEFVYFYSRYSSLRQWLVRAGNLSQGTGRTLSQWAAHDARFFEKLDEKMRDPNLRVVAEYILSLNRKHNYPDPPVESA